MRKDWMPKRGTTATKGRPAATPRRLLGAAAAVAGATLGVLGGGMALASASALAAPEAPVTGAPATSITATSAVLEGTLNPGATAKAGWFFDYSLPNGTSCTEGPATALEPEVEGKALAEHTTAGGLEPSAKYEFCMIATDELGESERSLNEVSFVTEALAPEVLSESASGVTAIAAQLEGTVNPNNQVTECHIQYGKTSVSEHELPCEPAASVEGFGEQGVHLSLTDLEAVTKYRYRVLLKNASAEEKIGSSEEFETGPDTAPSRLENGNVEDITTTSAQFTGSFDPGGQAASYHIEYFAAGCAETACRQDSAEAVVSGEAVAAITPIAVSGLKPNTIYRFSLAVKNLALSEPVHSVEGIFKTAETAAEAEAEANAASAAERASSLAAQAQIAEENARREQQSAAANAAASQRVAEITAVGAAIAHEAEQLRRQEELIAATSIEIVKLKLTRGGVQVTAKLSQAGAIELSGTGLRSRTVANTATGTRTVTLELTKAGREDRARHRKITVTVSLDTSLTSVTASSAVKL
jgi:hypothetical protein